VSDRIAEIDQDAVTREVGDKTAKALHDSERQILVSVLQGSEILRVELL
jgi:hypothetical protein